MVQSLSKIHVFKDWTTTRSNPQESQQEPFFVTSLLGVISDAGFRVTASRLAIPGHIVTYVVVFKNDYV